MGLWWFAPRIGLEAGAGITLESAMVYHADLMFTLIQVTDKEKGVGKLVPRLVDKGPLFMSMGIRPRAVVRSDKTEWSIRSPALFSFCPKAGRWELFYQFAWCLVIVPKLEVDADVYIGARYYIGGRKSFSPELQ
jgi:hypothetical protein